jgi:adenylylsulfate kinase-like enzyme
MIARVLVRAERLVIIDATAHRRAWRDLARASIANFAEVQLLCPLDVARERERTRPAGHHPRGIYARAGQPGATVPGVDVPYEEAGAPELTIDTTRESVDEAAARVVALARALGRREPCPPAIDGWAVWISGRPGTGKTTVVSALCERLARRGVAPVVLELVEFAMTIAPEGIESPRTRAIVTRAVVQAAKLLREAGRAVVIDGSVPHPEGAGVARDLIDDLAMIELVCPLDVCRSRERAVRWNLTACPGGQRPMLEPDLGLDYEPVVTPDLTLYTDVVDQWTAAEEVLRLVERLERAAHERRRSCA